MQSAQVNKLIHIKSLLLEHLSTKIFKLKRLQNTIFMQYNNTIVQQQMS